MWPVVLSVLLAQAPDAQSRLLTLERQAAVASRFRNFGVMTLVGTGVAREVRGIYGTLSRFAESRVLIGEPGAALALRQTNDAQVVAWIVTAAFAALTTLFFVLGFGLDPGDALFEAREAATRPTDRAESSTP